MAHERVLVADDEEGILEPVRFNLVRVGFDVACVTTGEEALKKAKSGIPDLIQAVHSLDERNRDLADDVIYMCEGEIVRHGFEDYSSGAWPLHGAPPVSRSPESRDSAPVFPAVILRAGR